MRQRPQHPISTLLHDPRDRLRWLVGSLIEEMTEVDYLMADLVSAGLGAEDPRARSAWGSSGTELADAVRGLSQLPSAEALAERYTVYYQVRNELVHGMRMTSSASASDGAVTHRLLRLERSKRSSSSDSTYVSKPTEQDENTLWQIIGELQLFRNEVISALMTLRFPDPGDWVAQVAPQPNP